MVIRNFDGIADTGLTARVVVEGGIVSRGSRGMLRLCLARRISPFLIFQAAAASRRAVSPRSHHCKGWMSSARWVPRRTPTNSPMHQALPFGGIGITRSKRVSPVQVNVLPSPGCCKNFASELLPLQASSMVAISGHVVPANKGFVVRSTSMCLTSMGGRSSGTSVGENRVVRGVRCRRTR